MDSFPETRVRYQIPLSRPIILGAVIVVAQLLLAGAIDFSTELMWFESIGVSGVFLTSIYARLVLFAIGFVVFLALFGANVLLARRLAGLARGRGLAVHCSRAARAFGARRLRGGSDLRACDEPGGDRTPVTARDSCPLANPPGSRVRAHCDEPSARHVRSRPLQPRRRLRR